MRCAVFLCCLLFVLAIGSAATTYVVTPDGTGDFPTIQAAVDFASDDDTVELTDGTFTGDGNRDIDLLGKSITVRSQSGIAQACVIDCQGTGADPHCGFLLHSGETAAARLEGITISGGWREAHGGGISCEGPVSPVIADCRLIGNRARAGGGIDCFDGAAPAIEDCYFTENVASWSGGGLQAYGSSPTILRCTFHANGANHGAAIYFYGEGTSPLVSDCVISHNIADHSTGGVHCEHFAEPAFHRCIFTGNRSLTEGGALTASIVTTLDVQDCTFWGNAGGSDNPTLANGEECQTTLWNAIIAATVQGAAVGCYPGGYSTVTLHCCDLYGNEGGDWVGEIAGQLGIEGNICEDPLFCDPESGDFHLDCASPCAPFSAPNPECDLIGAWPVGCGGTPGLETTWGGLRVLFRK